MPSMNRLLKCGVILLAIPVVTGCNPTSTPVAYVGNEEISQEDYLALLEMTQTRPGVTAGQSTLNQMIEARLLVEEAERQGVAPTQEELQATLTEFKQNPQLQESLQQLGLSDDQIIRLLIEPQLAATRIFAKMAGVTDADVKKYFAEHKDEFKQPEQARVRILQVADRKKAEEALKLVGKSSFETIVETFGGGPGAGRIESLQQGGFSPYPKEVVDAAFKLGKGGTSRIIEAAAQPNLLQPQAPPPTGKQYYLVHVVDKVPARSPGLENPTVRERAMMMVAQQKGAQSVSPTAVQDLIKKLRGSSQINVVRPSVKTVEKGLPETPAMPGMGGP